MNDPLCNINPTNYSIEITPTAAEAAGTLLYVSNRLSNQPRKDLNLGKLHGL